MAKAGWFLINDEMAKVNMDFNHDVNYLGMFDLETAILEGKPEGLKVFGNWKTIYEGLSQLPSQVQKAGLDLISSTLTVRFSKHWKLYLNDKSQLYWMWEAIPDVLLRSA